MDPNTNLKEMLRLAENIMNRGEEDVYEIDVSSAIRLAELVLAMNEWIKNGGFLPAKWDNSPRG